MANKQRLSAILVIAALTVTGIGLSIAANYHQPAQGEIKRDTKHVGEIYYIMDERTSVCFAVTTPGKTYSSVAPVDCTTKVKEAIKQDKSFFETK